MTAFTELSADLAGQRVAGRYRLRRLVAAGGMAHVWAGTDEVLNRAVAVKLLLPQLAADPRFVTRFRREAVAAARLNHPNIVSIYDTCAEPGVEAIVMELVRGPTLRQRLDAEGRLTTEEVLAIGEQVAAALADAHDAGLIHRDIKPANILLDEIDSSGRAPRVVVTDFGIAKAVTPEDAEIDLTRVGTVLGTAKYLAPEQVAGDAVDGRADLYALGAVLYEALCGSPPFEERTDLATARARLDRDAVPLCARRPDLPREVAYTVDRALARRPEDRYESAAELRAALLAASAAPAAPEHVAIGPDAEPAETPSFVRSERSWLLPTAIVLVVAALVATAGVVFGGTRAGLFELPQLPQLRSDAARAPSTSDAGGATTTVLEVAPISEVRSFDPGGGDGEHEDELEFVADGNRRTSWSTEEYDQQFPALKDGVGVVAVLDGPGRLHDMVLSTTRPGWAGEVYVADRPAPALSGWGDPVAAFETTSREVTIPLEAAEGSFVLVWISRLHPEPNVRDRLEASIGELTIRRS